MSSDRHSPSSKKPRIAPMLPPASGRGSDLPGSFSYAPSMRSASGSSPYASSSPSYYPMGQSSFGPPSSFEAFSSSRSQSQRNLPTPYNEYPLGSSSRPQPHRNASGDPFAGLLDDDPARQTHGLATQGTGYTGIDWPVHNNSGGGGVRRTCSSSTACMTTLLTRVYSQRVQAGQERVRAHRRTTGWTTWGERGRGGGGRGGQGKENGRGVGGG
ncbi:hypothetical protein B0H19DRAFT_1092191 [Mycena capillaripes]|nr:hypothetical protein B0H19DRAFT_1092191 [Mycena capillaripes]